MRLALLAGLVALSSTVSAVPSRIELGLIPHAHLARSGRTKRATTSATLFQLGPTPKSRKKSRPSVAPPKSTYKPIVGSYYADWTGDYFPPEKVDWSKFDLVYFAFAIPNEQGQLYWTQSDSQSLLTRVVALGHAAGSKVVVSCGGWTGSTYFSKVVSTSAGRSKLAASMKALIDQFDLDGIDIDWEYPGLQGAGNIVSGSDSANLAAFLKILRAAIGSNKLITMATSQQPFAGTDGRPMSSVASQAAYLDHILIMNYDVYASSSSPGPNAPLSNGCGDAQYPFANAVAAISAWQAAGMKANQLILGLPAYGYVSDSDASSLQHKKRSMPRDYFWEGQKAGAERRLRARQLTTGESALPSLTSTTSPTASPSAVKACPLDHGGFGCADTAPSFSAPAPPSPSSIIKSSGSGDLGAFVGQQIGFSSLVSLGALVRDPSIKSDLKTHKSQFVGHAGYTRSWDSCSSTPFLRNPVRGTVVTYDDDVSIQLKAAYAASKKIGGAAFWSADGDTSNYALLCAARVGLGKTC